MILLVNNMSHCGYLSIFVNSKGSISGKIFLFKLKNIFGHSKLKRVAARFAIVHHNPLLCQREREILDLTESELEQELRLNSESQNQHPL